MVDTHPPIHSIPPPYHHKQPSTSNVFITYNSSLKLLHKSLVSLDLLVALVGGEHGHAYGDRAVGLLEGDVDLLLELLHVQTRVMPVLYQRQVHVPDHRL